MLDGAPEADSPARCRVGRPRVATPGCLALTITMMRAASVERHTSESVVLNAESERCAMSPPRAVTKSPTTSAGPVPGEDEATR